MPSVFSLFSFSVCVYSLFSALISIRLLHNDSESFLCILWLHGAVNGVKDLLLLRLIHTDAFQGFSCSAIQADARNAVCPRKGRHSVIGLSASGTDSNLINVILHGRASCCFPMCPTESSHQIQRLCILQGRYQRSNNSALRSAVLRA